MSRVRSEEADAAFLVRFEQHMAIPIVLAAIVPIITAFADRDTGYTTAIDLVSWLVFVVDFVVHLRYQKGYLSTAIGKFDLAVVVLTAPWFLIIGPQEGSFVMLIRFARVARLVMATRGIRRLLERLGKVAIVAVGVVFAGALVAFYAERPVNPEFATFGDALWWGLVTLTTVGYGDIVPETTAGRFAGAMIMITGIGLLGVLAGALASFFRLGPDATEQPVPPTAEGDADVDLATEVRALRDQVAMLSEQISRLAPPR